MPDLETRLPREWIEMVAHHAAQHVRRGVPSEEAILLGIADYTAQIERLTALMIADLDRRYSGDRARGELRDAIVEHVARGIQEARS